VNDMRKYVSKTVQTIPPSGIRKFFDLVSQMGGVISLGVGEPDFVTPWHIREACFYSLEQGYTMYTSNQGLIELREEIALYMRKHIGVTYSPEKEILVTVGVSEAVDLALRYSSDHRFANMSFKQSYHYQQSTSRRNLWIND
jgi:aminotransferase